MQGRIVFINQAAGYLTVDIVNRFAAEFKDIVLITGSVRVQNTTPDPGIKIVYIARYDRGNKIRKSLSWLKATLQVFFLLKFRYSRYDKFYFTIPPTAYLMAPWFGGKYSILVYDLYPEALVANGVKPQSLFYRWWTKRNSIIFEKAHRLFTISEALALGMKRYAPAKDITVIPNWSAFSHFIPIKKEENTLLIKEQMNGKFIVQYSGNIGVTHNVESLIEVAERLKDKSEIVFQIIGRGDRSIEITRMISDKQLSNCIMLPFRDDAMLYDSLCAADLAVIILDQSIPDVSVPSKVYNIMSAALPVMAISSPVSGLSDLVIRHNIGRVFEKERIDDMCRFILELKQNTLKREEYARSSYKAASYYTSDNAREYLRTYSGQDL